MMSIILVAGVGRRLREHTDEPKCLLNIGDRSLIHRYLDTLTEQESGVTGIGMVVGYKGELIAGHVREHAGGGNVAYATNDEYEKGSALSLLTAYEYFNMDGDILLMDGDVYFEPTLLRRLFRFSNPNTMLVDPSSVNTGEEIMVGINDNCVVAVGRGMEGDFDVHGEWIGFMKMDANGSRELLVALKKLVQERGDGVGYEDAIQGLCTAVEMGYELTQDLRWTEIDTLEDVMKAESLAEEAAA